MALPSDPQGIHRPVRFLTRHHHFGSLLQPFSAGWKDPPHWHPDEVRTVVVLSGTLVFGNGDKWDESKFRAYPAGTFYSEPPKAPHFTGRRTVRW